MPPKNPADKKAADAAHEIEQRLRSHQPPLADAQAEQPVEPSTEETAPTGEASTAPSAAAAATSSPITTTSTTTTTEPLQYWQARIVLDEQQRRLIASDERFQEFARTNNWGM
ncbi:MAG: hypothetical protein Q9195_004570 [Heterodermia aff. obscurata]